MEKGQGSSSNSDQFDITDPGYDSDSETDETAPLITTPVSTTPEAQPQDELASNAASQQTTSHRKRGLSLPPSLLRTHSHEQQKAKRKKSGGFAGLRLFLPSRNSSPTENSPASSSSISHSSSTSPTVFWQANDQGSSTKASKLQQLLQTIKDDQNTSHYAQLPKLAPFDLKKVEECFGMLELHDKQHGFSARTRDNFGVDSFASDVSANAFAIDIAKLRLSHQVFSTTIGLSGTTTCINNYFKEKFIQAIRFYDCYLYLKLYDYPQDAFNSIIGDRVEDNFVKARDIFFTHMKSNFLSDTKTLEEIISCIPKFDGLPRALKCNQVKLCFVKEEYDAIYQPIIDAYKQYQDLSLPLKEKCIANAEQDDLEKQLLELTCAPQQTNPHEIEELKARIEKAKDKARKADQNLTSANVSFIDSFSEVVLKDWQRDSLKVLRINEKESMQSQVAADMQRNELPKAVARDNSQQLLAVCLYYYNRIHAKSSAFYHVAMAGAQYYVNKEFAREFKKLSKEDFEEKLEEKRCEYEKGLLKIVFEKSLEYIMQKCDLTEDNISFSKDQIIESAICWVHNQPTQQSFYKLDKVALQRGADQLSVGINNKACKKIVSPR